MRGSAVVLAASLVLACAPLASAPRARAGEPIDHEAPGDVHAVDLNRRTRHVVDPAAHPFSRSIAKLVLESTRRESVHKSCTATLLPGERHLLTALHCLYEADRTRTGSSQAAPQPLRMRGRYTIVFGYEHSGWTARHALVIAGVDLFAGQAVLELPEHDVALVRLPESFSTGGLRLREHRLEILEPRPARLGDAMSGLRGIALVPAAWPDDGSSRIRDAGLFAYAADREIGLGGRVLTVDRGCREALPPEAAARAVEATWVDCRGYPSGSGAPLLQQTAGGAVFVAGVAIEAEHVSRRVRVVPVAAFRTAVEAWMR